MVAVAGCDGRLLIASHVQLEIRRTELTLALRAAYRRQQQPHGPQDIPDPSLHHTSSTSYPPPPKKSLQLFLYCYILQIFLQRFGHTSSDTLKVPKAHTPFVTASPGQR